MTTIIEFLEARITEDEEISAPDPDWDDYKGHCDAAGVHYTSARARAECAAKRAIIRDHAEIVEAIEYLSAALPGDLNQDPDAPWRTAPYRHLAAIYKDHPDYQQEWAQ